MVLNVAHDSAMQSLARLTRTACALRTTERGANSSSQDLVVTKVKKIQSKCGGSWRYDNVTSKWVCSDGRIVVRQSTGEFDRHGEPLPCFGYFLIEPDGGGRRLYLY